MNDEHDILNSGFTEVLDFEEPNFEPQVRERSVSNSSPKKIRQKSVFANNVTALMLHGAIIIFCAFSPVAFMLSAMIFPSGVLSFLWGAGYILILLSYVPLSYRYLTPLPKNNLLSVSFLFGLLLLLSGIFYALLISEANTIIAVALNFPAFSVLMMLGDAITVVGYSFDQRTAAPVIFFTSAFLPPALIYLGLRMKMQCEK